MTETKTKYEDLAIPELISLLTIVLSEKDRVFKYHPNNPQGTSVVEEYDSLQKDIKTITELISEKS
jgi:hypothetical protein|tara:strand:- start:159 stop:356 length:198 start_codon:yes stop_codon:yes gene_type:complete